MMIHKTFLIVIVVLAAQCAIAGTQQDSTLFAAKNRILIYPINLLASELALGYEYKYAKKSSVVLDASFGLNPQLLNHTKYFGFFYDKRMSIRASNKFIIYKNYAKHKRLFVSPSFSYIFTNYTKKKIIEVVEPDIQTITSNGVATYYIQSKTMNAYAINIVYGAEHNCFKHFYLQYFIGGGIRVNMFNTTVYNILGGNPNSGLTIHFPLHDKTTEIKPSILFGLNFFIPIKKI